MTLFESDSAVKDPYRWLENGSAPRTRRWLEVERLRLLNQLGGHRLRSAFRSIIEPALQPGACETPYIAGDRLFFRRRAPGRSQGAIFVKDEVIDKEKVLFDPAEHGFDDFYSVSICGVHSSGRRIALALRKDGRDEPEHTFVASVDTGEVAEVPNLGPNSCLAADLEHVLLIHRRSERGTVWARSVFSSREVFICDLPSDTPGAYLVSVSESLFLVVEPQPGGATRAAWLVDHNLKTVKCLLKEFGHSTVFRLHNDIIFMLTDWDAPLQRVLSANIRTSVLECQWHEIIPEGQSHIENMFVLTEKLVLVQVTGADMQISTYDLEGHPAAGPAVPAGGSISDVRCDGKSGRVALEFSSPGHPPTIFLFKPGAMLSVWDERRVPFELGKVVTERVEVPSKDGTRVPMSLCYRKDVCPEGRGPILLTGYGGYGISFTPRYSTRSAVWVALGGIYATANIRGGGEFGVEWHRTGRREHKQNCFDDYIAAAEWLLRTGHATGGHIAAVGGSNGALTVAAAITERPDLFAAAILFGPLCDMLRFHLFPGGRLVGVNEYGSPDVPEEREWLRECSPYHRVRQGVKYPGVLVISGDADTRCDPMHARKMIAKLCASSVSGRRVLLDYHPRRGHAALMPLPDRIETLVNQFCFLFDELALTLTETGVISPLERS